MKMIVTWLLGVPVAVTFFFAVFAVDASKLSPPAEQLEAKQAVAIAPADVTTRSEKWSSEARLN
jgi:hypothetical protein